MPEDTDPRTLKTVKISCSVLNTLKKTNGATVTELSNSLDLSKGAVYNHLATLKKEKFVVKDNNNKYKISHRFCNFGASAKHRSLLYSAGTSEAERLAEETGESANLMIEEYGRGIYLNKVVGDEGIADEFHRSLLEEPDYLHWSSTGKAILAQLPDDRVYEIIDDHGLPAATEQTITSAESLFNDLDNVRDNNDVALNDEEQVRGVRAVGAPVIDSNNNVLGAISVSGPTSRISDGKFYDDYPQIVSKSANIIEVRIETRGSDIGN